MRFIVAFSDPPTADTNLEKSDELWRSAFEQLAKTMFPDAQVLIDDRPTWQDKIFSISVREEGCTHIAFYNGAKICSRLDQFKHPDSRSLNGLTIPTLKCD